METERRRFERVALRPPLRAAVGAARVYVLDTSVAGLRIAHQAALPQPGEFVRIELPTDMGPIRLDCEVVRTIPDNNQQIFQTGLSIVAGDHQSKERLRTLFSDTLRKFEN